MTDLGSTVTTTYLDLALADAVREALQLEADLDAALRDRELLSVTLTLWMADRVALARSRERIKQLMGIAEPRDEERP